MSIESETYKSWDALPKEYHQYSSTDWKTETTSDKANHTKFIFEGHSLFNRVVFIFLTVISGIVPGLILYACSKKVRDFWNVRKVIYIESPPPQAGQVAAKVAEASSSTVQATQKATNAVVPPNTTSCSLTTETINIAKSAAATTPTVIPDTLKSNKESPQSAPVSTASHTKVQDAKAKLATETFSKAAEYEKAKAEVEQMVKVRLFDLRRTTPSILGRPDQKEPNASEYMKKVHEVAKELHAVISEVHQELNSRLQTIFELNEPNQKLTYETVPKNDDDIFSNGELSETDKYKRSRERSCVREKNNFYRLIDVVFFTIRAKGGTCPIIPRINIGFYHRPDLRLDWNAIAHQVNQVSTLVSDPAAEKNNLKAARDVYEVIIIDCDTSLVPIGNPPPEGTGGRGIADAWHEVVHRMQPEYLAIRANEQCEKSFYKEIAYSLFSRALTQSLIIRRIEHIVGEALKQIHSGGQELTNDLLDNWCSRCGVPLKFKSEILQRIEERRKGNSVS